MLIIQLSQTIVAGAPLAIARGIRQYSKHESVAISHTHFRWQPDINAKSVKQCAEVLSKADVIHWHGNVLYEASGAIGPLIKYINRKAKFVWQAHSNRKECPTHMGPNTARYRCLVVAQGWDRYWPATFTPVRNPIFIEDPEIQPIPFSDRKRQVAFTPSNRFCRDNRFGPTYRADKTNPKGWRFILNQLKGLPLLLIENEPYKSCLDHKRNAWVGIDEVVTPMYHRSGLEFLAQGVACIELLDEKTIRTIKRVSGSDQIPFVAIPDPFLVREVVQSLLEDAKTAQEIGLAGRKWMETYWHPRDVIAEYVEIYESL